MKNKIWLAITLLLMIVSLVPLVHASSTNAQVTITSAATLILAPNVSRTTFCVINIGAVTVWYGSNSTVSTTTGIPLNSTQPYCASLKNGDDTLGPLYGITA